MRTAGTDTAMRNSFRRPHPTLLATEMVRAVGELHAFTSVVPFLAALPRGDGHSVLVLPGFTGDDRSTVTLRWFLTQRGYRAMPWELGRNLGPTDHILDGMDALVERLAERGDRASIVGWSLGGIFARVLGRSHPTAIRSVITLGSPFQLSARDRDQTHASDAYEALSALHSVRAQQLATDESRSPLTVPTTNIFSRTDGVVPWRSCIDTHGDQCENIEVPGSHSGLGHNPIALAVIADRLAQPEGEWKPYVPQGCLRALVRVGPLPSAGPTAA